MDRLRATHVLLVGLGGVGSFAGEFLCRAGIGAMTIVDGDVVDVSNTNRQLIALHSTVGQPKAQVMACRLHDINPSLHLTVLERFLQPRVAAGLVEGSQGGQYDFVVDCIDSLAPKVELLLAAQARGMKVISSMGAGGRMDPSRVRVADIADTTGCPLAAHVRRTMRIAKAPRGSITAIFSDEAPVRDSLALVTERQQYKRSYFGTISYMPALFGLCAAAEVVKQVLSPLRRPRKPRRRRGLRPQPPSAAPPVTPLQGNRDKSQTREVATAGAHSLNGSPPHAAARGGVPVANDAGACGSRPPDKVLHSLNMAGDQSGKGDLGQATTSVATNPPPALSANSTDDSSSHTCGSDLRVAAKRDFTSDGVSVGARFAQEGAPKPLGDIGLHGGCSVGGGTLFEWAEELQGVGQGYDGEGI